MRHSSTTPRAQQTELTDDVVWFQIIWFTGRMTEVGIIVHMLITAIPTNNEKQNSFYSLRFTLRGGQFDARIKGIKYKT